MSTPFWAHSAQRSDAALWLALERRGLLAPRGGLAPIDCSVWLSRALADAAGDPELSRAVHDAKAGTVADEKHGG